MRAGGHSAPFSVTCLTTQAVGTGSSVRVASRTCWVRCPGCYQDHTLSYHHGNTVVECAAFGPDATASNPSER